MAIPKMTNKKVRDLNPVGNYCGVYSRYDEYFNLLLNSVKIVKKGTDKELDYARESFVKTALFNGSVGYDKITDKFYFVYGEGLDELGNPTTLTLVTANGLSYTRKASYDDNANGAYRLLGLPNGMALSSMIRATTDFMTNCDVAMIQNLNACKTPYIVVCKDEDLRLSYLHAIQQKQEGQAVVIVSEDLGDGLKAVNIGVDYLVDKFADIRDRESNRLLNKLGIMTSNEVKKERVQSAEVNATIGQATDYIYLIIDTFNKQCESYGIPYEMKLNGSLEEIYLDDKQDDQPNANNANATERTFNND